LELPIPISSLPNDFEGFEKTRRLPGGGVVRSSILAKSTLVSAPAGESSEVGNDPESSSPSVSRERNFLLQILDTSPPSRVDFLREAYSSNLSRESAEVLIQSIRKSSRRQYETAWKAFTEFIRSTRPDKIDDEVVLSFMKSIFDKKGFAPATVATYKSGLSKPLLWAFGLDLAKPVFQDFYKGLLNIRPSRPQVPPEWSLEDVLLLLSSDDFNENIPLDRLTQKTLFLLTLATGGRISEMQALKRGEASLQFRLDGSLHLIPDPEFLAKNEDPASRRAPIYVSPLFLDDGSPSPLCPVECLRSYLKKTSFLKEGALFLNPKTLKAASCAAIRYTFRDLIILTNPEVKAKFHDVRKWASSLAFFSGMSTRDLCDRIGWTSVRVFKKHYLKELRQLPFACVSIGNVTPASKKEAN